MYMMCTIHKMCRHVLQHSGLWKHRNYTPVSNLSCKHVCWSVVATGMHCHVMLSSRSMITNRTCTMDETQAPLWFASHKVFWLQLVKHYVCPCIKFNHLQKVICNLLSGCMFHKLHQSFWHTHYHHTWHPGQPSIVLGSSWTWHRRCSLFFSHAWQSFKWLGAISRSIQSFVTSTYSLLRSHQQGHKRDLLHPLMKPILGLTSLRACTLSYLIGTAQYLDSC